ncbi:DNA repair protein RadC [Streptococcus mitis]|uniref:DNA repair protein RadC n=1 Tax=Streptococcus mitis TaxID=28037 RepID=A0A150NMF8_STRMT|nr:DNA repair protein RadC [Streptococcus mitis]
MYSISFQEDSLLPRERLVKEGVEALSNQELLAILLRTGTRQASVFEIAQKVLNNLSSLTDLKKMTLQELQSLSGIGRVKAIELQAMIELGHRIHKHETLEMESILSSQKLAKKMQQELGHKNKSTWWRSISILKIKSSINRPFLSVLQLVVSLSRERFFTMLSSIWRLLSSWFTIILQER